MGEIISIISAKGGAGKTSIAVNLAHVAACYGLKTLVVDCDLYTNGATIFYNLYRKGRILDDNPVTFHKILQMCIADSADRKAVLTHTVTMEESLEFIPSGKYPVLDLDKIIYGEYEKLAKEFSSVVSLWEKQYDVVILDQPSGINTLINIMVSVSTKVLLVRENDKLGLEAARELYNYLSGRTRQIIFCTNKISEDQYSGFVESKQDDDIIIKCVGFKYDPDLVRNMAMGKTIDPVPLKVAQRDKSRYPGYVLANMSGKLLNEYALRIDEYLSQKQAEDDAYVAEEKEKRKKIKKKAISMVGINMLVSLIVGVMVAVVLHYTRFLGWGGSGFWGVFAWCFLFMLGRHLISRNDDYKKILREMRNEFLDI